MTSEEVHTVAEVAADLRVAPETIYRAIRRREIEVVQVGRVIRVPDTSLQRLRRRTAEPRP